jgi:hypothetical protein
MSGEGGLERFRARAIQKTARHEGDENGGGKYAATNRNVPDTVPPTPIELTCKNMTYCAPEVGGQPLEAASPYVDVHNSASVGANGSSSNATFAFSSNTAGDVFTDVGAPKTCSFTTPFPTKWNHSGNVMAPEHRQILRQDGLKHGVSFDVPGSDEGSGNTEFQCSTIDRDVDIGTSNDKAYSFGSERSTSVNPNVMKLKEMNVAPAQVPVPSAIAGTLADADDLNQQYATFKENMRNFVDHDTHHSKKLLKMNVLLSSSHAEMLQMRTEAHKLMVKLHTIKAEIVATTSKYSLE